MEQVGCLRAAEPAQTKSALQALAAAYRAAYPSFVRLLEEDLDALVVQLRFLYEHRRGTRSTNLLERTFVEVRRRAKVIGRFPGETSALSLIWAVLELASRGWRGVTITPRAVAQIERPLRALAAGEPLPETDARRGGDRRLGSRGSGVRPEAVTRTMGPHLAALQAGLREPALSAAKTPGSRRRRVGLVIDTINLDYALAVPLADGARSRHGPFRSP